MKVTTGYEEKKCRIEMVPLMDIIFLLLTFFIYAMVRMTVFHGLRVDLPRGQAPSHEVKSVIISIARDNGLWLDGRPVSLDEAVAGAAERAVAQKAPVCVSGDRAAALGTAVELLSRLRSANVEAVSFQVKDAP